MTMPKAALDLNNLPELWQDNVRLSRQFAYVEPESEAKTMERSPDNHFRFGVN